MIKKLLMVFGILIGLVVIAAIAVPFFVDVDKYRPQIVSAANEKLNGKLELGKLSLSLWGQIRIQIAGLELSDARGRKVVAVKDAFFHLPFTSVLSGAPALVLNMKEPAINVVKDKNGKMNVTTLMKPSAPEAGQPSQPSTGGGAGAPQGEMKLPGMLARARIGMEIRNALLTYKDETSGLDTQVRDLNVIAKDISLSRKMSLEVFANLDTEMKAKGPKSGEGGMVVKGPARLILNADPKVSGGKFESLSATGKVDLDDLEILMPGAFHKAKGIAAHADLELKASPESAQIDRMDVKFHNAEIKGKGTISNLSGAASPVVAFQMKSNVIDLKPWNELVPPLKQYELGGNAELSAEANGPADKLGYKALFKINGMTAKAPNLKAQPKIDALVSVITDQIDNLTLTMKAPGNDLNVRGKLVNFNAPKMDFTVTSSGMDLDQLIEFPPPGAKSEAAAGGSGGGAGGGGGAGAPAQADLDAQMAPVRENKMLQNMIANINLNMKSLKAYDVLMTDIAGKMSMRDLVAAIDSFGMKLWGGSIKASGNTNLRPKTPTYKFDASVDSLDLQKAVTSRMAFMKNTVVGKASFNIDGTGSSFNTAPATKNLNAKGKLKVVDASFATIDISKMVNEGLGSALEKVGDKVPGLKGKKIGMPAGESKYEVISTDFTISGGVFKAPNFVAKSMPGKGLDLKGETTVNLVNYSLDANWLVADTHNMTKAKDVSVSQGGIDVPHILAEGNGPVQFPISIGCTVMAPCYKYGQVPEYLTKVALGNATGALKGKAKSEIQKKAGDLIKSPAIQDKLKGLFGR